MTETPPAKSRIWRKIFFALALLTFLLLLGGWWLTTAAFWQQVGWRLVAAVQDRLQAQLSVAQVSGNLISGMVFRDVTVQRSGEDILRVAELEVSVSVLSFFKLQPVIRTLIFRQPVLSLRQGTDGAWNVANLLKKRPPPPFAQIQLSHIEIQDGTIQFDRPNLHQVCRDLNVRLHLKIHHPGRPQLQVAVHEAVFTGTVPPDPAWRLQLALTYSAQELVLQPTEFFLGDLPGIQIEGALTDLTTEPQLALTLKIPKLAGPQLQQLWSAWPADVPLHADLAVTGPLAAPQVAASGSLQDCRWQVQGTWQRPTDDAGRLQLSLAFTHLKPGILPIPGPAAAWRQDFSPLSGSLTINASGQPLAPDTLAAQLSLEPFTWRQAKVESASLTVTATAPSRQGLNLNLQGNFGRLAAEVTGPLWPRPGSQTPLSGEFRLTTSGLNPALLVGSQAPPGALDSTFTGNFQVPAWPAWRQARLTGTLQASGRLQEHRVQEFFLQGGWEKDELRFDPVRLRLGNLSATAQGRLSVSGVEAKLALNLAPPGPWPLLPADFKGQGKIDASVQGTWQSLAYQLRFQGQALSWRRLNLQALQGQVAGTASRQSWNIAGFDLQAQDLATPVGRFGKIQGSGRSQDGHLVFDLKAADAPGHGGGLAGTAAWEQNGVQIRLSRLQWGPPDLQVAAEEPVTVTVSPGFVQLTPLRLRYRQTILFLAGKMSAAELGGQVRLENLQFADLNVLIPQLGLFRGAIQAHLEFSGSGHAPILRGQVQVSPGAIGTFNFDAFQTSLTYQGNQLSLHGQLLEKPEKGRLTWQGTAPLTLTFFPWTWQVPDQGLQVRVWTDNLTLALFPQLIPQLSAGEGPMHLQAQISGSLRQPLLSGALKFGPGTLTVRESGAPFALEPGEIRLEGDRLVIGRLHFLSGDGTGDITGGARISGFRLQDVHLTLKAVNLLAIRRAGSWAVANGQATLSGSWPNFTTAGRLTVSPGQFRVGFFRASQNQDIIILPRVCRLPDPRSSAAGAAAVVRNFTMNLDIDIPGSVWLRDKEVNIEMVGQFNVRRRPPGPKYLGGWVKAKEGVFAINNKTFTIDKAMLIFPGEPHKPMRVEARASRQVDDYTLSVFAMGPMDSLRTGLESNPPLPPRDQLSLLLFDHLADKMTREEYITVTQRAMGLLGSLTAQQLKTFFGDKLPLLGEVSPTTSQEAVGVGKKLGRGLTVSYDRKLNPLEGEDVNQIRLNYKIHKYLSAETQLGRKNPGGDLFFNIDF